MGKEKINKHKMNILVIMGWRRISMEVGKECCVCPVLQLYCLQCIFFFFVGLSVSFKTAPLKGSKC